MSELLFWVPPFAVCALGIIYLVFGESRPLAKILLAALFFVGIYFQFFASGRTASLIGLLIQVVLGISLSLWLRAHQSSA